MLELRAWHGYCTQQLDRMRLLRSRHVPVCFSSIVMHQLRSGICAVPLQLHRLYRMHSWHLRQCDGPFDLRFMRRWFHLWCSGFLVQRMCGWHVRIHQRSRNLQPVLSWLLCHWYRLHCVHTVWNWQVLADFLPND